MVTRRKVLIDLGAGVTVAATGLPSMTIGTPAVEERIIDLRDLRYAALQEELNAIWSERLKNIPTSPLVRVTYDSIKNELEYESVDPFLEPEDQ